MLKVPAGNKQILLLHIYSPLIPSGDWRFHSISDIPIEPDLSPDFEDDDGTYVVVDEDADFDESQSSGESDASDCSQTSRTAIRHEAKMLDDMSKYLIPYIGSGVENVVLAHSKGLTNGVVSYHCILCFL